MPIYEYEARDPDRGCAVCRFGFEQLQSVADAALTHCPHCGGVVFKRISACAVGHSVSSMDDRAKSAGFQKLKRLGKGEYEKVY